MSIDTILGIIGIVIGVIGLILQVSSGKTNSGTGVKALVILLSLVVGAAGIWFLFTSPISSHILNFKSHLGIFTSIIVIVIIIGIIIKGMIGEL